MIPALLFIAVLLVPARGTVYSASSTAGPGYAPRLAFDGDEKTRWSAAFSERSGWIQVTFEKERTFGGITIRGEGPELKGMPGKIRLLFLGKNKWRPVLERTNTEGPSVTFSFEAVASRSFRLEIDSVVNPRWSPTIAELLLLPSAEKPEGKGGETGPGKGKGTPQGPRREKIHGSSKGRKDSGGSFGPSVTASASSDRGDATLAADGDLGTSWEAPRGVTSGWLRLDFDAPREFNFLSFDVETESGYGVPRCYRLEALRGGRWRAVLEEKEGCRHFARKAFQRTKSSSWRLVVDKVINDRYPLTLSEMRLSLEADPEGTAALPPPPAATPPPARVRKAVERGRFFLLGRERDDGSFDSPHGEKYPMGVAGLGALALMKSGLKPADPPVAKALAAAAGGEPKTVYGTALSLMAVVEAGAAVRYRSFVEKGARFLVAAQDGSGAWGYPDGRPDRSNAQYALLGLDAAARAGIEVPAEVWMKAARYFVRTQLEGGGWNYVSTGKRASDPATGSMTAAGVASLLLARHHAGKRHWKKSDFDAAGAAVERGFEWLGKNFTVRLNPGAPSGLGHYYYLYGLERVGRFGGRTRIGGHGWFGEGAAHLLRFQRRDGGWQGSMTDTCFALLFLTQSSRPLSGE